jgi:hypothetical protein
VAIGATATGQPPPSFQWFKDGQVLPGQTALVMALEAAVRADEGDYELVVTNSAGVSGGSDEDEHCRQQQRGAPTST